MAAEVQVLVLEFKYAFIVKDLVEKVLHMEIKPEAMIDSRTVFNVVSTER